MDSRQLYIKAKHLATTLTWESDWIHFGTGEEIKSGLIEELIMNFLDSDKVNLVFERTNSETLEKPEVSAKIQEILGTRDFELWNESMNCAIQLKGIGVLLKGKKESIKSQG